ncbi:MAG: hypothetical protein ACPG7F_07465 [Aggregatilineales bacterium]
MSQLEVVFEVPQIIASGLATGQYQRIGGVIVERGSKQVVAWLRDGGLVETATSVAPGNLLGNAVQTAASLADGHLTRQSIHALGQTVESAARFTATGQVINLAISGATLLAVKKHFQQLQTQLEALEAAMNQQFEQDRTAKFTAVLDMTRDALEMTDVSQRQANAKLATESLYEARNYFLDELDNLVEADYDHQILPYMQNLLRRAMLAHLTIVKCYMIRGDDTLARKILNEKYQKFEKYVDILLQHWLSPHGAIYFHPEVDSKDMARYLQIQKWRDDKDAFEVDATFLLQTINNVRGDFWNQDVEEKLAEQYGNILERVTRRPPEQTKEDIVAALADNLAQAEILIENFERLRGFELELQSMRLMLDDERIDHLRTLNDWEQQITEDDLMTGQIACIMNPDLPG